MDQITFHNTKKKGKKVSLVHSSSKDHDLQTFDETDDVGQRRVQLPSSRNRSHSVFVSGFTDYLKPSMKTNDELSDSECGSTDLILSKIESLPKLYRRSNRRIGRLNTQLLEAVESGNVGEVHRLLEAGASPNATCHVEYISACHIAALTGGGALTFLLKYGAVSNRPDRLGRTPLHIAAWAGHIGHIGLFLNLPEAILKNLNRGVVTAADEEEIRKLQPHLKDIVNNRCELGEMSIKVPKEWRSDVDHSNKVAEHLPYFQPGWTPLHAASCSARQHCVKILLAAGADPCLRDVISRTPLDVAGSAYYTHVGTTLSRNSLPVNSPGFAELVKMLLTKERNSGIRKRGLDSPLHAAVELQSVESVTVLLTAGACAGGLNRAGESPLHIAVRRRLKELLQVFIYSEFHYHQSASVPIVDVRDKDGYTVLHSSVLANWLPGVCLALEAGANTISRAYNGETPLHSAANLGYLDILKEILIYAKESNVIDEPNKRGETALFKAVAKGNIDCVRMILNHSASIEATLPDKRNVFHVAANLGLYEMLKLLLDYNYTITRVIINHVAANDRKGYGPIHFAVERDHLDCFKLLLSKNAYINLKATGGTNKGVTPLHIAAKKNNHEIAKLILINNPSAIHMQDELGLNALHTACYYSSRDVIKLLLRQGSDISAYSCGDNKLRKTAIELIMNNLSKPTEFIHEIFDSCITCNNKRPQDPNCEVTVDYGILVPNKHINSGGINEMEMKVLEALLKTGNSHDQRRLLIHPLVESFLCLKWQALLPFFYIMLALYGLFVMTLSLFIISVYCYRDDYNRTENETKSSVQRPEWLDCRIWSYVLYFTISLIVCQEFLYMKVSRRYFFQLETWLKFSTIGLAVILPEVIFNTTGGWTRHLATIALLLSWLQMTFFLSRFPKMGYYVLMFRKVSTKVLKILLTFMFLIIGFAFSFMIEYRSRIPFENPWSAFVKTMVMMTSEFDYDDLVDKKDSTNPETSMVIIRLLFLIFLVLAAIVLMNLMVAVAVNDLNDLEVLGNIMRLEKQIEFLASLDTVVNYKFFMKILPRNIKYKLMFARSLSQITLRPCEPSWSYSKAIAAHVKDAILDKAQSQKGTVDEQISVEKLNKKIDNILDIVMNSNDNSIFSNLANKNTMDKKLDNSESEILRHGRRSNSEFTALVKDTKHKLEAMKQQIETVNMKLDTVLHSLASKRNSPS